MTLTQRFAFCIIFLIKNDSSVHDSHERGNQVKLLSDPVTVSSESFADAIAV